MAKTKNPCQTTINLNIPYNAKCVVCTWWVIMIRTRLYSASRGGLVVWNSPAVECYLRAVILAIVRKIWFIHSAPGEHQLKPEVPNHERMDSGTMLEFQTGMANLDYQGSRCLSFMVQGVQFTRIGLAPETKWRQKSWIDFWSEKSVSGEKNNSALHKVLLGCDASLLI